MASNRKYEKGQRLNVACTHPASPASGNPCRFGEMLGVAENDEDSDGNTVVDFGPAVYNLPVKGHDGTSNAAVAVGDKLYYDDTLINDGTGPLNKDTSKRFFGYALAAVTSGSTSTIAVKVAGS